MSKAFTKEDDGTENVHLDDLPQSPHPNLVTPSGLAALNSRLGARQSDLAKLREKAEEIDRKLANAVAQRDIRFLEARISRAILVDPKSHSPGSSHLAQRSKSLLKTTAARVFELSARMRPTLRMA